VIATAIIKPAVLHRFARAEVNVRRNVGWVEAARACGDSHFSVVLRFLLPNVLPAMAVQVSLNLGWAILNAAGTVLHRPRRHAADAGMGHHGRGWRAPSSRPASGGWFAFPGLALMLAVLCFNLLGDGIRDILDPRMRT